MKKGILMSSFMIIIIGIVPMIITAVIYEMNFGKRYETGQSFAYKTEDFEGLQRRDYTFQSKQRKALKGYYYFSEKEVVPKALVVLAHGFGGGGHTSYMPEINALVEKGYGVFTYDVTGNDASEGRAVRGMPQGILDLDQALYFVEEQEAFEGLPILLYGHSWGAYSVMSELASNHEVTAAVAACGFNQSMDIIIEQGTQMYGKSVQLLKPYIKVYEYIKFGKVAHRSSLEGLQKTTAKVLVIHSKDDPVISFENNFSYFKENLIDKGNIQFLELKDRGHEFARSAEIQSELKAIVKERSVLKEQYGGMESVPAKIKNELIQKYKAVYSELDKTTMETITLFYDNALGIQ